MSQAIHCTNNRTHDNDEQIHKTKLIPTQTEIVRISLNPNHFAV